MITVRRVQRERSKSEKNDWNSMLTWHEDSRADPVRDALLS